MSIRELLLATPETIQEFSGAAEQRYFDGLELLVAGRTGSGIYLMGYCAEMILKYAYFRFRGIGVGEPISLPVARRRGRELIPDQSDEHYHSLLFWKDLLIAERRWCERPMRREMEAGLHDRVRNLYQHWWVEMRYRIDRTEAAWGHGVYEDVSWLRKNQAFLWR